MAERSFEVTVSNMTGRTWTRTGMDLAHGIWENNGAAVPPETIPRLTIDDDGTPKPGVGFFGSESNGFGTGTEGSAHYVSDRGEHLDLFWDDPFVGSNTFTVNAAPLRACFGNISGNNAHVTVRIQSPSAPC
jgi:Aegerolysin